MSVQGCGSKRRRLSTMLTSPSNTRCEVRAAAAVQRGIAARMHDDTRTHLRPLVRLAPRLGAGRRRHGAFVIAVVVVHGHRELGGGRREALHLVPQKRSGRGQERGSSSTAMMPCANYRRGSAMKGVRQHWLSCKVRVEDHQAIEAGEPHSCSRRTAAHHRHPVLHALDWGGSRAGNHG